MAIIVCKNCGKNISDSCEKCIHCGTNIKIDNFSTTNQDKPLTKTVQKTYEDLPEYAQLELENEFIEKNADMMKYKRKIKGAETFANYSTYMFFFHWIIFMFFRFIFQIVPKFSIHIVNKNIFSIVSLLNFFFGIIGCLLFITGIISKKIINNKIKSFTYIKKLKIWLEKEKGITYNVLFQSEKEHQIFNQLEI